MVVEKGYAKINLGLEVIKKREDNYHDLSMIMTTIDLYDELYFEETVNNICIIEYDNLSNIKIEDDLIYQSYRVLKERYNVNKGLKVKVIKRIPLQAGLGGGSADAAATLRGLNTLWGLNLSLNELAEIGLEIGSDVPFCVYNQTAKVAGRGEIIEFIDECPYMNLLLVFPDFKSSTANIFSSFTIHSKNKGKIEELEQAIKNGNLNEIANRLFNDLEQAQQLVRIAEIKTNLLKSGALGSLMSGSGSTVYGICYSRKHAISVQNKYHQTNEEVGYNNHKKFKTLITATRSFRRANISVVNEGITSVGTDKVLKECEIKAYGMIDLLYRRNIDNYEYIKTPISLYDNIHIAKTDGNKSKVYINGTVDVSNLSKYINELSLVLGYGLKITIKKNVDKYYSLIDGENYLSAIITALECFGEDTDKLYSKFKRSVQAYYNYQTVLYNSKDDKIHYLDDAVFSYIVLIPMGIKDYKSPRYTKQIDDDPQVLINILSSIKEKNFYKMATAIYNGVGSFDARKIIHIKGFDFSKKLEEISINSRASGFMLMKGGKYAIALFRNKKNANHLVNLLKRKYSIIAITTSLKSRVTHLPEKNKYLKQASNIEFFDLELNYQDYSNPFESEETLSISEYEKDTNYRRKRQSVKKELNKGLIKEVDFEGILYLHSGGSIFKQYDFRDIARYFQKYFHDKYITFLIDNKEIPVRFDVSYLPHILGMHKFDDSITGRAGFDRLIKGEVTYNSLKDLRLANNRRFVEIRERTQSSILIFNDIINNRLYDISCYNRNIILRKDSKNELFEYGVTRKLTSSSFHRQNLLGIGKDPKSKRYFFITSYLWKVPAHIGKKDSLTISIIR